MSLWHSRLGHPSSTIVSRVVTDNNLPCASESNNISVCDACQQAKSHQLPYSRSSYVSTSPFELVYSDVWGPAPKSVSCFQYYVIFIDDYSKHTWICGCSRRFCQICGCSVLTMQWVSLDSSHVCHHALCTLLMIICWCLCATSAMVFMDPRLLQVWNAGMNFRLKSWLQPWTLSVKY